MANFSASAQTNTVASPPVNSPATSSAGRVRVFYDSYTVVATEAAADTITFGAETIPKGARILSADVEHEALGGGSVICALACGGITLIATSVDMVTAGVDAIDGMVAVTTSAGYPILTLSTRTSAMTAAKTIQLLITYVID